MFPGEHKVELGRPATEFRSIFFGLAIPEDIGIFTVSLVLHFLTPKVHFTLDGREVEFAAIDTNFVLEKRGR